MPTDPSFVAHVLDLLAPVGEVTARAMFGGHGIYAEAVMFGLLDDDELFLKTDDATRATFVEAGCRQWHYVNKKVRMENTGYFRPPDEAHEDPEAMAPWARLALESALRARAKKGARGKRTAASKKSPSPPPQRRAPAGKISPSPPLQRRAPVGKKSPSPPQGERAGERGRSRTRSTGRRTR